MRSLWKVEIKRLPRSKAHFKTFIKWVRKIINNGTDRAVALYGKYDKAKQLKNQFPFEFNAYLTSFKALIENQVGRGLAIPFFAKLLKPLRDQIKASSGTLPENRRQMVAKTQCAWEVILKKGRPNQD